MGADKACDTMGKKVKCIGRTFIFLGITVSVIKTYITPYIFGK